MPVASPGRLAAVVAVLAFALLAGPASAASPLDPDLPERPFDLADLYLAEAPDLAESPTEDGVWFCPWLGASPDRNCPDEAGQGGNSLGAVQNLVSHIRTTNQKPRLLRVGKARKSCPINESTGQITNPAACRTGVPSASPDCAAGGDPGLVARLRNPFCHMLDLKGLGVGLGVIMGAGGDEEPVTRSVRELAAHACQIHRADYFGLYDFLFIDETSGQGANIKEVVARIHRGEIWNGSSWVPCTYNRFGNPNTVTTGWDVITNDNPWKTPGYTLNTVAWGHAKHLRGMHDQQLAGQIRDGNAAAIQPEDEEFIARVRDADQAWEDGSTRAVLRFEVAQQTAALANWFGPIGRRTMLHLMSSRQQRTSPDDFALIHPLFVHGNGNHPTTYDSVYRQTFACEMALLEKFGIAANQPGDDGPSGKPPACE